MSVRSVTEAPASNHWSHSRGEPIRWPEPVKLKTESIVGQDLSLTLRVADGADYIILRHGSFPKLAGNLDLRRACASGGGVE